MLQKRLFHYEIVRQILQAFYKVDDLLSGKRAEMADSKLVQMHERRHRSGGQNVFVIRKIADPVEVVNDEPEDFRYENATFTVGVDEIKIREDPSLAGKDTGYVYESGTSVNYDGYAAREGYVWILWIGQSGTRRWMACGRANAAGANVEPWGTFS